MSRLATPRARWAASIIGLVAACGALAPGIGHAGEAPPAAPTQTPEDAAEALHKQALEAFKKGERATAISFWLRANEFHPFWKYSYNLANAYYQDKDYLTAWRWLAEAKQTMRDHLEKLGTLEANLSLELAKTHAFVDIQVLPPDAVVMKDGEPWRTPRALWTTATAMRIEVSSGDYQPLTKELTLAPGTRIVETYVLVPKKRGELVVTGTPDGAIVAVRPVAPDGTPDPGAPVTVGALPRVAVVLQPGRFEVTIDDPDHIPRVAMVDVVDGATFELPVTLRKKPPVTTSSGLDGQQVAGIITGGAGLVAGIIGAVLLADADGKASDIAALNEDVDRLRAIEGGYEGYLAKYDDLKSDKELSEVAGWVTLGVGAAALVTGVVMVVTGGETGPPDTKGTLDLKVGFVRGVGGSVALGFGF